MAKTTFILEADAAKAVNAFLKVVDAQNKAIDGTRKMSREGKQAGKSMDGIGRSVAGWLAGFASVGTVVQGLKNIVAEMNEATQLQKEMMGTAVDVEQIIMKIAHLHGDVSAGGLAIQRKRVGDIAKETALSLEVTANALFYGESAMGIGPPGESAARVVAKFAGAAGLKPEETMLIPAIFKIIEANTEKQQMAAVNQLRRATWASIAETGPFVQPFIEPLTMAMQWGLTYEQALAQMTAGILSAGGVEKGATAVRAGTEIALGKTGKALEFFYKESAKRKLDYGQMRGPERYEFLRELFVEFEKAGPAAMDILKVKVGGKGFKHLVAMFGKVGREKYAEVLPLIETAEEDAAVQRMFEQYLTSLTAITTQMKRREQISAARIGERRAPLTVLEDMSADILKKARGGAARWETVGFALTPAAVERHRTAYMLIRENVALGLQEAPPGSEWERELKGLQRQLPLIESFKWNPEFVERAYGATEGFTLPEKLGRYAGTPKIESAYERGFRDYFDFPVETAENLTKGLKDTTEAINRLADKIPTPIVSSRLGPDE